jgi:putative transposase
MPNFRRFYQPNAIVFITSVTDQRKPLFSDPNNRQLYWKTLERVQTLYPFHLLSYALLPDHFHWLLQMPEESPNFSVVLKSVKMNFTRNFKSTHGVTSDLTLWQNRFWDHLIRDEDDLQNHFDYIHWNPVKHGWVKRPEDWESSTYLHWQKRGYYEIGWGWNDEPKFLNLLQTGE